MSNTAQSRSTAPLVAAGLGALVMLALGALSVPVALGAHPWWGSQVAMIGAGAGAVLAFGFGFLQSERAPMWSLLSFFLAAGAFGGASWGQMQFAASYAENTTAGQIWFFGWIVLTTGITMGVSLLMLWVWQSMRPQ